MRIKNHPILDVSKRKQIEFIFEGKKILGCQGDTVASALHALGIKQLGLSILKKRPRGFYCAIGNCSSCNMTVNGTPNTKTCLTKLKPGMVVNRQENKGVIKW